VKAVPNIRLINMTFEGEQQPALKRIARGAVCRRRHNTQQNQRENKRLANST
jgi:hypothetical protein